MSKIELHTEVEEAISAEDVAGFRIKKVELSGIKLETPVRTLYCSTEIPTGIRERILSLNDMKKTLLEVNRTIYRDESYHSLMNSVKWGGEDIKRQLRVNDKLANKNLVITMSFSAFPHKKLGKGFEDFLDNLHAYSRVVFVPNVRFGRKTTKTSLNYSPTSFTKYIELSLKVLSERNTKSIFVPLDIDFDSQTRNYIISHYAKNKYTNIWIDFKGKAITPTQIAKIRGILRVIDESFGDLSSQVVTYLANVKKIPRGLTPDIKLTPSDVLGPFVYGDIVGVPWKGITVYRQEEESYWERKGFSSEEEYKEALFKRDTSIFDTGTCYYWYPDMVRISDIALEKLRKEMLILGIENRSKAEKISSTINGAINLRELTIIKKTVEDEGVLSPYLEEKEFFTKEGKNLLKTIITKETSKRKTRSLFDFVMK